MSRAYDRLLAHIVSQETYVKRTVYVRLELAYRFRKLGATVGFHVGDLARIMMVLGLVFRRSLLTSDEFVSRTRLSGALEELERLTGRAPRRPYAFGKGPRGVWISVWLPRRFLDFTGLYAKALGKSRNETLALFFQYGLFLYLIGETRLLKALQPKETTKEQSGRVRVKSGVGSREANDVHSLERTKGVRLSGCLGFECHPSDRYDHTPTLRTLRSLLRERNRIGQLGHVYRLSEWV